MTSKRPVHEIRFGRVKAAIWENSLTAEQNGPTTIRYNVTLSRLYHDGKQWKTSESFGRDDLPLLIKVASLAHDWTYQQAQTLAAPLERSEVF